MTKFNKVGELSLTQATNQPNTVSGIVSFSGNLVQGTTANKVGYIGDTTEVPAVLKVIYSYNSQASTVVYQGLNGNYYVRELVPSGHEFWVFYYRIVASATINGQLYETEGSWGYGAGP